MNLEPDLLYKPLLISDVKVSGLTVKSVPIGAKVDIVERGFINSSEQKFSNIFNNTLLLFVNESNLSNSLNKLLVIIKPDNQAFVYKEFPLSMEIKAARDILAGTIVRKGDFIDINSVSFQDSISNLNPEEGDQIVWLFRNNWHFGLHFDFSRQLDKKTMLENAGHSYNILLYLDLFQFFSNINSYKELINDGWFPFIGLLSGQYENLIRYYSESKENFFHVEKIFEYFDNEVIFGMIEKWWGNPVFNAKKVIITSGIDSYLAKNQSGYISCIKNLISEIEGIIRVAYFKDKGKNKGSVQDLKNYIVQSGHDQFNTELFNRIYI